MACDCIVTDWTFFARSPPSRSKLPQSSPCANCNVTTIVQRDYQEQKDPWLFLSEWISFLNRFQLNFDQQTKWSMESESNGEATITANLFFIIILNTFIRLEKKGKSQLKSECHHLPSKKASDDDECLSLSTIVNGEMAINEYKTVW